MKFFTSAMIITLFIAQAAGAQMSTDPVIPGSAVRSESTANWDAQGSYWHDNYSTRPYYDALRGYAAYEPAYRYGVHLYNKHPNMPYEQLDQAELRSEWGAQRGTSTLEWEDAQQAARDAYDRMYNNRGKTPAASSPTPTADR